jgi:diadenosine tetraphosphate (Ap4A) HIT family hydrolase
MKYTSLYYISVVVPCGCGAGDLRIRNLNVECGDNPAIPFEVSSMEPVKKCPFCNPFADEIVAKNDLCYARWDRFPVSKGHLLLMPFRHTPDFFSLSPDERVALFDLVLVCKGVIEENFRPAGYNIGINVGEAAGQTVMHCHCHMIPRYAGDVSDTRGGIRGVVPGKREY